MNLKVNQGGMANLPNVYSSSGNLGMDGKPAKRILQFK